MPREDGTQTAAQPLSPAELELIYAWRRAANYLSVSQIYLLDNPLLERPLERADIKPRMACAGDVPTMETLAAVDILRHHVPDLKIRVVNVVDLPLKNQLLSFPRGSACARLKRGRGCTCSMK